MKLGLQQRWEGYFVLGGDFDGVRVERIGDTSDKEMVGWAQDFTKSYTEANIKESLKKLTINLNWYEEKGRNCIDQEKGAKK